MKIFFWINQLSIHQSSLVREMCNNGWKVTVISDMAVSKDRLDLGWEVPDFGDARLIIAPSYKEISFLVKESKDNAIHIFGAALQYIWGNIAFYKAIQERCKVGLISEACDPDGWKAPFRWVKHSMRRILFERSVHFILAMGEMGVSWFKECGYPIEKLFPFTYVVEPFIPRQNHNDHRLFIVLYVGQLIPRKCVSLLLEAFSDLHENTARLVIIGDGPEREKLKRLSIKLGIESCIAWQYVVPYMQVRDWMAKADVLVLPSRFDGWGAVVNEALLCGTPVICTDYTGAADLLKEAWCGEVVPRNNRVALANALKKRFDMGYSNYEIRSNIRNWAKCLSGQVVVRYLESIFAHIYEGANRPIPPWYN